MGLRATKADEPAGGASFSLREASASFGGAEAPRRLKPAPPSCFEGVRSRQRFNGALESSVLGIGFGESREANSRMVFYNLIAFPSMVGWPAVLVGRSARWEVVVSKPRSNRSRFDGSGRAVPSSTRSSSTTTMLGPTA